MWRTADASIALQSALRSTNMAGQGFHHVAIRAIDFDATLKFYPEGLGCSVRFEFSVPRRIDRAVFLDMGDGRYIEVFGQDSTVQSEGRRRSPDEESTEGLCCTFASGSRMSRPPMRVRSLPARFHGSSR
jgi:hypothetical protein